MNQRKGLFEELKRRNVFRVAAAYLITAWVLLQIADLVLQNINAPDWVIQTFMLALGLGFPIAVIFAWAFELTPEGLKKEKDVDRTQSITHKTGRKLDFTIIGVLAVAVVILLVDRFAGSPATDLAGQAETAPQSIEEPALAGTGAREKSIAVLPFVNMSSDAEQEYFSDGISEEILNALARVKDLKVAGRTSSFAFKGENQDLRQIGEALGVEHILEGSVRKSGNKVRITAQLIQVDDGFHLWSDTYDRELDDVFVIQDEISSAILEQLKAHLLEEEQVALVSPRADSEAYDQYLLAKQRIYERSRPALESAAKLLDQAIAADPDYAPAYAQRAIASLLLSDRNYGTLPQAEAGTQAKLYIDQALRLDPNQPEALAALGLYHMNKPGEDNEAIQALERSLAINPNLVNASNWLQSAYADVGRIAEAISILEDLRNRDPLYRPGVANLNNFYIFQNRLDEARQQIEDLKPFMPNDPFLLRLEANVLYSTGEIAEGLTIAERALSIQPDNFPNIGLVGRGLDSLGLDERLATEGHEDQRAFALARLGRMEEATIMARELADSGEDPGAYIGLLANYGQQKEAIQFLEQRWADLDAFELEYPASGGRGISTMLDIAYAYASVGNEERFNDAMQRSRRGLDKLAGLGFQNSFLEFLNAVYLTMNGEHELAIASLDRAVDQGMRAGSRFKEGWAALTVLEGDPAYEAAQQRMFDYVNAERAELGLDPIAS